MPSLLVIGFVWPEPRSSAAGYRMLGLLEAFKRDGWQVTFACPAEKSVHRADLRELGIEEREIVLNCDSFDHFVSELNPTAVMFDRFMLEEQFGWRVEKVCPGALRILDTEDLFTLRRARHEAFKDTGEIAKELSPAQLCSETAKREIASILRCDLTLMISAYEMDLLISRFTIDPALLLHLPFMLPPVSAAQQQTLPAFAARQHFIAIGNFRHPPNWDAVLYLKECLWPLIRRTIPDAELHIYGAYPPKKATALHDPKQGFKIMGWADDARAVMQQARVNLAPLRFGAGLKGKLVDAMACGTPSVTTHIGAEGLADGDQWPGIICDDPAGFAEGAAALYLDQSRWQGCQQRGFELYNQSFDFVSHADRLMARIGALLSDLDNHRLNNFTGAMLRHHHLRSSEYMGQWIALKNRLKT